MAYIYDLADTWNAIGTTFTGIKLNVTDSASAAGSMLMDLQVGGSSRFNVRKDGRFTVGSGPANYMVFAPAENQLTVGPGGVTFGGIRHISGSSITLLSGTAYSTTHTTDAMLNGASGLVGWHAGGYSFSNLIPDLALARDAANTLAQRNGVNAQALNLYNTFTDASNFERGFMKWVSNRLEIGVEAAGTGTSRSFRVSAGGEAVESTGNGVMISRNNVGRIRFAAASMDFLDTNISIGSSTGRPLNIEQIGFHQLSEMTAPAAPVTNAVRIYAEDDGAGKTRIMARFATGAAVQIAIEP